MIEYANLIYNRVSEIFDEIKSCLDYIEEQIEGELPDAFLSVKEDIEFLRNKFVLKGGTKKDGV